MSTQPQQDAQFESEFLPSFIELIERATAYRVGDEDRDYWLVEIPEALQQWAWEKSREEVDERDARDKNESNDHAYCGKCGEIGVAVAAETAGVDWEWIDAFEKGDLLIDGLRADIKTRVENDNGHMDLLVGMRSRGDERDLQADAYIQVLLSEDYSIAMVSGYALNFEVQEAGPFPGAQTHPSKMVMHSHLRDIGDLI